VLGTGPALPTLPTSWTLASHPTTSTPHPLDRLEFRRHQGMVVQQGGRRRRNTLLLCPAFVHLNRRSASLTAPARIRSLPHSGARTRLCQRPSPPSSRPEPSLMRPHGIPSRRCLFLTCRTNSQLALEAMACAATNSTASDTTPSMPGRCPANGLGQALELCRNPSRAVPGQHRQANVLAFNISGVDPSAATPYQLQRPELWSIR